MEDYIVKDGRRLRLGYTTGTCAAAAAKAAALLLLTGRKVDRLSLHTPKGLTLDLPIEALEQTGETARCAVRKDAGDDPDVTDGALIWAQVSRTPSDIIIDGGEGVGRVTKPGLDQPVGQAAINSVPRQMIAENLRQVLALADAPGGLKAIISVPQGAQLAQRTFNPRLGIEGGISILGTTGIVEPMSEAALVDTIRVELRQRRASGADYVLLTPGNYGSDFLRTSLGIDPALAVQTSNFIGDSLDLCRDLGFRGALLVGHIGKLVKVAGGMLNTHSKYGDCRLEILAAHAGAAGAPPAALEQILACVSCDEGLRILGQTGCLAPTLDRLTGRVAYHLAQRAGEGLRTGCVLFSKEYGLLGRSEEANQLLQAVLEG